MVGCMNADHLNWTFLVARETAFKLILLHEASWSSVT